MSPRLAALVAATDPTNPTATRGQRLHEYNAQYLMHGIEPDYADPSGFPLMWFPAASLLAPWAGRCFAELELSWTLDGLPFQGTLDGVFLDLQRRTAVLHDLKSSSDPKRWGLDAEGLASDVQSLLYSAALIESGAVDTVLCVWTYIRTWGPNSSPCPEGSQVTCTHTRADIAQKLADTNVLADARAIAEQQLADADPLTLDRNLGSCRLYPPTGCTYAELCTDITLVDRIEHLFQECQP